MPDIVVIQEPVQVLTVTTPATPTVTVAAPGPQGAPGSDILATYTQVGPLSVADGTVRHPINASYTVRGCYAMAGTAPVGAPIIVDVLRNGVTLYTTPSKRPTIPAGSFASAVPFVVPDVTGLALGDYLTCSIVQVGSSVPGSDLSLIVIATRN